MAEIERIEYLRKNGRRKGKKKGVLFCGIDPDDANSVILGFSVCNVIDRFDYINGQSEPGFGLNLAKVRAEKWKLHTDYFVQNSFTEEELYGSNIDDLTDDDEDRFSFLVLIENPNPQEIVEIPPSVLKRLKIFIERCKKYYKDKDFPEWVENVAKDNELEIV